MYLENTADTNVVSNLPLDEHVNSLLLFIVFVNTPKNVQVTTTITKNY